MLNLLNIQKDDIIQKTLKEDKMKVYKKRLPKGVRKMFSRSKGVKVKLVNIDYCKKNKNKQYKHYFIFYNIISTQY